MAVIAGLLACQPVALGQDTPAPIASTPDVRVATGPPVTMTPTPTCMSVSGVNLDAVLLSTTAVRVNVTGLNPNERPTFVFYSEVPGQTFRIESRPLEGAHEDGGLEHTQDGLVDRTSGVSFKDWHIQVIHSRGVACTTISLP